MRFDEHDPDGVDPDLLRWAVPAVDRWLNGWYDHDVRGLECVPEGPCLLVGNHNSGAMFMEAIGFGARAYQERPEMWGTWNALAHDNIIRLPWFGRFLHRLGALRASHASAHTAFSKGRKVMVFPGGNREAFRPWSERYQVGLGDRRGFIRLAQDAGVPIVPVVFVGGHSGLFILRDNKRLARLLRAPRWLRSDTWPLTFGLPWGVSLGPLFHLPLPVGCITEVLPALSLTGDVEEDFRRVESSMQVAMARLSRERRTRAWPLRRR